MSTLEAPFALDPKHAQQFVPILQRELPGRWWPDWDKSHVFNTDRTDMATCIIAEASRAKNTNLCRSADNQLVPLRTFELDDVEYWIIDNRSRDQMLLKIEAFGEVRSVMCRITNNANDQYHPYCRATTKACWMARFRTGTKCHRTDIDVFIAGPGCKFDAETIYRLEHFTVTTLNRNATIVAWWDDKFAFAQSQHGGSCRL